MPRRQRFKPSRKPKPAIEASEQDVVQSSKPTVDEESRAMNVSQRDDSRREEHPDPEDRAQR